MPRRSLNVDEGKKGRVRKRGSSSPSSSSLMQNYRLKRALLVGKKGGSSTPAPMWKMMSSESPSIEDNETFKCVAWRNSDNVEELSVSARKLAAILWEINGVPSPRPRNILEDRSSEVGSILESSKLSSIGKHHVSKRKDPPKQANPQEKWPDCIPGGANSVDNCFVQVYPVKNHGSSDFKHLNGLKNRLRDMYDGLRNSKELLKVLLRHLRCVEQLNTTSLSVVSALEFELDRACKCVENLNQGQMTKGGEIGLLLREFESEGMLSRIKERDLIHYGLSSIARELKMQKMLRRRTEELNKKLRTKLSQTKASLLVANKELEAEKKEREMVEYVCGELARGIGEDRAAVEERKRQTARLHDELEREREMLQLADMLREERVQMKLSEAKYLFEEKNAVVDGLRNELEVYLKSKPCNEQRDSCPRDRKIVVLEKYVRETCPGSGHKQGKEQEDYETVNKEDEEEDSDDSDLCSIKLNMDDIKGSFIWGGAVKNENSLDKSKGQKSTSEKTRTATCPKPNSGEKQNNSGVFKETGLFGFTSDGSGRDIEDEMKRYRLIKDLRDHIVSSSRAASSQDLSSPSRINLRQARISPNDADAVACHG